MIKYFSSCFFYVLFANLVIAQPGDILTLRKLVKENAGAIMNEYTNFLALPNVAADPAGLQKNAAFIMDMMQKRNIQNVQLLSAVTPGVAPAVYGEVKVPGARQTLIFYAHYDGQPVNPAQWATGLEPFSAKLFTDAIDKKGTNISFPADGIYNDAWRIYARSASDDKAGVAAILNAYAAIRKTGLAPHCNLKFFFEGEEGRLSTS
jgi:acetylornithine deacetylase/succinyl-diaminopimelate desuccinylase-like protein